MDSNRLFMVGVVILLLGIQFRLVESFELNTWASNVVEKRFPQDSSSTTSYVSQSSFDAAWSPPVNAGGSATRLISPPRQLGLSFISLGAILILVSPAYRK